MGGIVKKGDWTYGDPIIRGDISNVYIGKYCSIAQNVIVDCGWGHNYNFVSTFPFNAFFEAAKHINGHPVSKGDITIGNDVWIGEGSVLMGGINVGDGAVVGTNSVVTTDVKPYSIVGGVPSKHIKYRFDYTTISKLIELKWWEYPHEKIMSCVDLIMSKDVEGLINKIKQ